MTAPQLPSRDENE